MEILDLLFPKICLNCGKEGRYVCGNCIAKVKHLDQVCPYCEKASIDGHTHARCYKKFGLDGLTSIWKYEGVIKKAIWALKFKHAFKIAEELSELITPELVYWAILFKHYLMVPIPVFKLRENMRGFNQSEIIGSGVACNLGIDFNPNLLFKTKPTVSQVELTARERKRNLRGSFSLKPSNLVPSETDILLFDDVFTTGSTLNEASCVLKKSGFRKVWGITLAR